MSFYSNNALSWLFLFIFLPTKVNILYVDIYSCTIMNTIFQIWCFAFGLCPTIQSSNEIIGCSTLHKWYVSFSTLAEGRQIFSRVFCKLGKGFLQFSNDLCFLFGRQWRQDHHYHVECLLFRVIMMIFIRASVISNFISVFMFLHLENLLWDKIVCQFGKSQACCVIVLLIKRLSLQKKKSK